MSWICMFCNDAVQVMEFVVVVCYALLFTPEDGNWCFTSTFVHMEG